METAERGGEKQVLMGKRLEDGLSDRKRGDVSTPPPQWRLELLCQSRGKEFLNVPSSSSLSARKLCATLWKIEPHQRHLPVAEMARKYNSNDKRNKGFELPPMLINSPDNSSHQVAAENGLRREDITGSLIQNHCRSDMADLSLHRASHARDDCAIEVAACRAAVASTSLDCPRRLSESNSRKSAELLKVVDRIRRLEERNASNISFAKGLKVELEDNQANIRKLLQEKASPYNKNNAQNRSISVVESLMDELESERNFRNRLEILHRKAARELSELKSCFSEAMKELESERKERILLENLCEEFAKGVRDYEKEVRSLKHKAEEDWLCGRTHDGLILQISEAWLDERMQAKLGESKNNSIANKLHSDIESFLQAKRGKKLGSLSTTEVKETCSCRHSLESYQLNDAGSAPKNMADEEDYSDNDSQCTEKTKRGENWKGLNGDRQGIFKSSSSRKNSSAAKNQCATGGEKQRQTEILAIADNSTWPSNIKENTLMAKLLEARLQSKSRLSARKL